MEIKPGVFVPRDGRTAYQAFLQFIKSKPGLDPEDYAGYLQGYYQDRHDCTRSRKLALLELYEFDQKDYSPERMAYALEKAYSGRLSFNRYDGLEYCPGQYYPTEYRWAALAVLELYNKVTKRNRDTQLTSDPAQLRPVL